MEIKDIYDILEANLDNCTDYAPAKMGKLKRIRLPIPEEYGGGIVTGYGYEDTIRNLIKRVKDKIKSESEAPSFKECWEKWIEIKEGQNKSQSTIANYHQNARVHLLPYFGSKKIDQITADDIQKYFNTIMNLSESISTHSKTILKGVFDRAVRLGYIPTNIMLYGYERSRKKGEKVVLQDDNLIEVINKLDQLLKTNDVRDYLYFCFLCFTALRRGEILGLHWSDIDFTNHQIIIKNNVTFPNGKNDPIVCKPKNGSFGCVHLNEQLAKRIKKYAAIGNSYIIPYSFSEPTRPITRSMFTKLWQRCTKIIDVKGATSHSFRASYATMLNAHCDHVDPKVLQSALRHKTPDLAIKVYTKENKNKTKIAEQEYESWLSTQINAAK